MTVVVGVDTSDTAVRAAESAARLAVGLDTDLVVVCAFSEKNSTGPSLPSLETTNRERALKVAQDAADELARAHPELSIRAESEPGRPAEVLIQAAYDADADVVVVGNRHAQGVSRVLGSVAADVVRTATCDVYVAYTKTPRRS